MNLWLAVPSPSPTGPPLGEQAGTSIEYWIIVAVLLAIVALLRVVFGPPGPGRNDW